MPTKLPGWVNYGLLPLMNLGMAFLVAGFIVVILGESPIEAVRLLVFGAFGYGEAVGYTLFYTTNFIFTGLAVALAFQCGLFNIGGEGQAYIGGLGVGLVGIYIGHWPVPIGIMIGIMAAALFGGIWGFIPGWLQARRGSHTVITTIMLNFIAASIMTYLLVNPLRRPGQQIPESMTFDRNIWLPQFSDIFTSFGQDIGRSPLNVAFVIALVACLLYWLFVWKTRAGYEMRVVGRSEAAAVYGGISPAKQIMIAMTLSGALAGMMSLNEVLGAQHRLTLGFTGGYGFVGIAVALMGRGHPVGIVLAAVLFGALYQGGSELAFDMPRINRDMVVVIQGLVILFAGALEHMFRPWLEARFARPAVPAPA